MLIRHLLKFILLSSVVMAGCRNNSSGVQEQDSAAGLSANKDTAVAAAGAQKDSFNIAALPVSDKVLDSFPFFKVPPGMQYQNKPVQKKYDMLFLPLNGVMTPEYGSVFKTYIVGAGSSNDWSLPLFRQYYEDSVKAAGGVEVYNAKVPKSELDRIKDKATYFGEEGSIDYWNDPVEVYVIRRAAGGNIFIQFSGNSASGAIQILQAKTAAEAMQ